MADEGGHAEQQADDVQTSKRKIDESFMLRACEEAKRCEAVDTAYNVGAVLVSADGSRTTTGFSRELPGNTHAEQVALHKMLEEGGTEAARGGTIYCTMEPCSKRLSGNESCTSRILQAGVARVVMAAREPDTFVACEGVDLLQAGGVQVDVCRSPAIDAACAAANAHIKSSAEAAPTGPSVDNSSV